MNCRRARELLEQLMTGSLSGEEARAVRMHVASCAECAAGLTPEQWVEVLPALDETIEPSGDFAARFHAKLKARPQPWWSRIARAAWPRRLAAAGALAAIALVGMLVIRDPGAGPDRAADLRESRSVHEVPPPEDMAVIGNLDLLENFDTIENLPRLMEEAEKN